MRVPAVNRAHALQDIQRNLLEIGRLQEKVASGMRVNRASDDPSALVISERLRAQLAGLSQSEENVSRSLNTLNTAEGALGEASDLLRRGQALALEAAGASSDEERTALQGELDGIVGGLRRLGNGTQFAGRNLVDGSQGFSIQDADAAFAGIQVDRTGAGFVPGTVSVEVAASASQAQAGGVLAASQAGDAQFEVSGAQGSAVIQVSAGATRQQVADAINASSAQTGVQADATTGEIRSVGVGSESFARIRNLSGSLTGITEGQTSGADARALVNGQAATARGDVLTVGGGDFDARITLDAGTAAGTYTFRVAGGGFAIPDGGDGTVSVGLPSLLPSDLGRSVSPTGLESTVTGGPNSLLTNPEGAAAAFAAAADDVTRARGRLGAVQTDYLGSIANNLQVAFENIAAADSRIRDTDFAATLADLAKERIKAQAGISVLAQSRRLEAGNVLRLLG